MSNGGPVISRRVSRMKVLSQDCSGWWLLHRMWLHSPPLPERPNDCRNAGLSFVLFSAQADRKALWRVGMLNSNACMST
jgi:hypothetical protein